MNQFLFFLLLTSAFSSSFAQAGLVDQVCNELSVSQTKRMVSLKNKLSTCSETVPAGSVQLTCDSYRTQIARLQGQWNITDIFQNYFSNWQIDAIQLNCQKKKLQSSFTTYAKNGASSSVVSFASLQFDQKNQVVLTTPKASYSLKLAAGIGMTAKAELFSAMQKDGVDFDEQGVQLAQYTDEQPIIGLLSEKLMSRYSSLIVKSYGPKIGFQKDRFQGYLIDESRKIVNGVHSDLDGRTSFQLVSLLYSTATPVNNVTVGDPKIIFEQQRNYVALLNELSKL